MLQVRTLLARLIHRLKSETKGKADPLLLARGSGKCIRSSESADEYIHRLRD